MRPLSEQQAVQQQQGALGDKGKPTVIVRASPAGSFRWRVVVDAQTVGSGDAATEFAAREAANEIVKRIEAKPPEAP
jgi:hypothetical protein